jgi:DNA (cytosine-5)-methyltransferase 1
VQAVPHCVLDVFAGAGGLSLGFAAAGYSIVAGAERDRDACDTFAKAHPGASVFDGDVGAFSFRRLRTDVDVVVGGPPCQPWSSGGKRLGAIDPRDGWPAFVRVLEAVRPVAFVAENVAGLASIGRRTDLKRLLADVRDLQFHVVAHLVNAADYGVAQNRRRLMIVGLRDRPFKVPRPTHGAGRLPPQCAGEVVAAEIFGVPNRSVVTYARRPDLRPGAYDGHLFNGGGRPIDLARPAPTLLASMGGNKTPWLDTLGVVPGYHAGLRNGRPPREGIVRGARRITMEEAARLQTFPDAVQFVGSRASCYRQVGNAVPPRLAEAIALALARQLPP